MTNAHAKTCSTCGEELELIINGITSHPSRKFTNSSFVVHVKVACDCNVMEAKATELTHIEFHGDPPGGWE